MTGHEAFDAPVATVPLPTSNGAIRGRTGRGGQASSKASTRSPGEPRRSPPDTRAPAACARSASARTASPSARRRDGVSRVTVTFEAKDRAKSVATLQHERLADAEEAARTKAFWRERLARADGAPGAMKGFELRTLATEIAFGECPRWHEDRLWFSDWGAQELVAVDLDGRREVVARVESFPFSFDWLPDGTLVVVSAADRRLLRLEPDGSFAPYADLSGLGQHPWNEIVVDGRGNAYVNNIGFDFPAGEFAPGTIALVAPDGSARQVADGVAFPNGMAVTPDDSTLVVAESYGSEPSRRAVPGESPGFELSA
jgi:SMP-30/Gluconolactonase/LRE-like region